MSFFSNKLPDFLSEMAILVRLNRKKNSCTTSSLALVIFTNNGTRFTKENRRILGRVEDPSSSDICGLAPVEWIGRSHAPHDCPTVEGSVDADIGSVWWRVSIL